MRSTSIVEALATGALLFALSPAHAQDATAGKDVFGPCAACHTIDDTSAVAPTLKGVVGRKIASVPGFRYSRALKSTAGVWDDAQLDAWIADPQKSIPGNLMPFSGVSAAQQRADLIAYLKTL